MQIQIDLRPKSIDEQCDMLEEICEAAVQSHVSEIDDAPEDTFPCCVKCGKLQFQAVPYLPGVKSTRNAPLTSGQRKALEHTLDHGHPTSAAERGELAGILRAHSMGLRIRNVAELSRKKVGTAVDLAVFQCAQDRIHGKTCSVVFDYDEDTGDLHPYVKYADGTIKNPQDDTVPGGPSCGCAAPTGGDDG